MNARTYGYGNQHVERVAIGPGAKAVANACGAAGVLRGSDAVSERKDAMNTASTVRRVIQFSV